MNNSNTLSGTAMAVLLGFGSIFVALFAPVAFVAKIIFLFIGISFSLLGVYFSKS